MRAGQRAPAEAECRRHIAARYRAGGLPCGTPRNLRAASRVRASAGLAPKSAPRRHRTMRRLIRSMHRAVRRPQTSRGRRPRDPKPRRRESTHHSNTCECSHDSKASIYSLLDLRLRVAAAATSSRAWARFPASSTIRNSRTQTPRRSVVGRRAARRPGARA